MATAAGDPRPKTIGPAAAARRRSPVRMAAAVSKVLRTWGSAAARLSQPPNQGAPRREAPGHGPPTWADGGVADGHPRRAVEAYEL